MPVHREPGSFTARIEPSAEFRETYEGDADGNVRFDPSAGTD